MTCTQCGKEFRQEDVIPSHPTRCRACRSAYYKKYAATHKEQIRKKQAEYHAANREARMAYSRRRYAAHKDEYRESYDPIKAREYHVRRTFGISVATEQQMLEEQGGCCAICGTTEWKGQGKRPHVDHDHATGEVRGILCSACNMALGYLKDDVTLLARAIEYLTTPRERPLQQPLLFVPREAS